jgi:hypothetical protein
MDNALNQLWHIGSLVYGVAVIILTFTVRKIVETAIPSVKKKADENDPEVTYATTFGRYWNQVILYVLPPTVGMLIALMNVSYLHGESGPAELGGRIFNGIVIGGCSAMVYKMLKKRGVDLSKPMGTPSEESTG